MLPHTEQRRGSRGAVWLGPLPLCIRCDPHWTSTAQDPLVRMSERGPSAGAAPGSTGPLKNYLDIEVDRRVAWLRHGRACRAREPIIIGKRRRSLHRLVSTAINLASGWELLSHNYGSQMIPVIRSDCPVAKLLDQVLAIPEASPLWASKARLFEHANALRERDFTTALHSLRRYFDSTLLETAESLGEQSTRSREQVRASHPLNSGPFGIFVPCCRSWAGCGQAAAARVPVPERPAGTGKHPGPLWACAGGGSGTQRVASCRPGVQ